jgi:hypothetical protein
MDDDSLNVPVDSVVPIEADATDSTPPYGSSGGLTYEWSVLTTDCGAVVVNDTASRLMGMRTFKLNAVTVRPSTPFLVYSLTSHEISINDFISNGIVF